MTGGYIGRDLVIDLDSLSIEERTQSDEFRRKFIGGYGFGAKFIFGSQRPGVAPLGSDNILGFTTGPLTGTSAIFGSRFVVVGKSPLTHTWGDTNCGGDFGPYMKFAGVDNVYFKGCADKWVYLLLDGGKAELRDATHLVGKDTTETEDALKKEIGTGARVACIGPAGEKLSLIANIITNKGRAAGRQGLGAVMGSKKLKAIAVRGRGEVPVHDSQGLRQARSRYLKELKGFLYDVLKNFGTCGLTASSIEIGDAPTKNWLGAGKLDFPEPEAISDERVIELQEKKFACWRCPVACGGFMKGSSGKYSYSNEVMKPEYETLASFGALCLNQDLKSIIVANDICNRYGIDTISAGAIIAFAIECYENGLITKKDTDGIELRWGNSAAIVAMLRKMVAREGFGEVLADGVRIAAQKIGKNAEDFAIHIQGQEVPMHDPRRHIFYGPIYWLDPTPARHTQGSEGARPPGLELPQFDRKSYAGRGEARRIASNLAHLVNCAGMCILGYQMLPIDAFIEFINRATGWDVSLEELIDTGERILDLRQAFNIREGLNPAQFNVPGRVIGQPPLESGPLAGRTVDLPVMINDYIEAVKWDRDSWIPSSKRMEELGIKDVADELARLGYYKKD